MAVNQNPSNAVRIQGYQTTTPAYVDARVDAQTNTLQIIEYEHHEIHSGSSFTWSTTGDVNSSATRAYLIITPNTAKHPHCIFTVVAESETLIYFNEKPNISLKGTAATIYNRNRTKTTDATASIYTGPSILSNGTRLWTGQLGSGKTAGGLDRGSSEWVLASNSTYAFKVVNNSSQAGWIKTEVDFYEHTDIA
jgi:hypothetical protein